MEPAAAFDEIALPEEVPFLGRRRIPEARADRHTAALRGRLAALCVLADPSPEEWDLVRTLIARYGSLLRV